MSAKNIVRGDAASAESAKDHRHPDRLATKFKGRGAVTHLARAEFFQMRRQHLAQFRARLKAMLRLVFDGPHQDPLNLAGKRGIDLAWPGILGEIKDQKRIV